MKVLIVDMARSTELRDLSNRESVPRVGDFICINNTLFIVDRLTWNDLLTRVEIRVRRSA